MKPFPAEELTKNCNKSLDSMLLDGVANELVIVDFLPHEHLNGSKLFFLLFFFFPCFITIDRAIEHVLVKKIHGV